MLFLDPTEFERVTVKGVEWLIGPVPARVMDVLRIRLAEAQRKADAGDVFERVKAVRDADGNIPDPALRAEHAEAVQRWAGAVGPVYRDFVKWGIRGWNGAAIPFAAVDEQVDGVTFQVLAPRLLEMFSRVDGGDLVVGLGNKVRAANELSMEDLLGFK